MAPPMAGPARSLTGAGSCATVRRRWMDDAGRAPRRADVTGKGMRRGAGQQDRQAGRARGQRTVDAAQSDERRIAPGARLA
jgi:hypothetical protein